MNIREVHNVVKSAKSKLLQEQNNINNVMIDDYITEELHRRTQRSGAIQIDNNTASYSNDSYGSLEELMTYLHYLLMRLKNCLKHLFKLFYQNALQSFSLYDIMNLTN
ncbi:hypothetical protein [Staphylococcus phage S25-3]|uniref:Uncharacterized protein n=2 Tax=Kayvirus TaxID=1857843 RepID=V5XWD4_BPS25|nr:hypothetical protein X577_gp161 [Staphylococcus phage S25-4]YP_008854153.1 hypothetical protein X600_gp188 [Staphylococcus phage S25-3]BAO09181.1 hypothetical protein [Staphylococcus phage S25-3]BAO09392.1 hypothetical protein [Staphylococcus phage S25-4]